MAKHPKCILLVSALLVSAVGVISILIPRNEPKYQGRYLREWMEDLAEPVTHSSRLAAANQAVEQIGTNAVPFFVEWLGHQTPQWKIFLHKKLPRWIARNGIIDLSGEKDLFRTMLGAQGISILGTNAASAIPKLTVLLQNRTNVFLVNLATEALAAIGEPSLPVLQTAFADTNQLNRAVIFLTLHRLSLHGYTNECSSILKAGLEDHEFTIRNKATNLLGVISTNQLRPVGSW